MENRQSVMLLPQAGIPQPEQEQRFRQMVENIDAAVWLTDVATAQLLYVSPACETILGASCDPLYSNPALRWDAVHPDDRTAAQYVASYDQSCGEYDVEYRVIRPDGSLRHIHERAFPIRDMQGKVYRIVGTARDITSRKEQEACIRYLANHDMLTGLPNRALMMERLQHAVAYACRCEQRLAVLLLDLDHFKMINDTLGHPIGDSLLQRVAERLALTLNEAGSIARLGGDEFLLLLSGLVVPEEAAQMAARILAVLSSPFEVANYQLHIYGSIGISVFPQDADQPETLLKYADSALHLAKKQGRNTFRFFCPELDASVRTRLQLENALRSAIDNNELFLHYQPLLDLGSGRYSGVEALLRWQHPELGLISPVDFIPVAEETGLILSIGEWVLRRACRQARIWQNAGMPNFRVSVNLSRRQLEQTDLTARLRQILHETACPAQLLELEITESSVLQDPEQAIARLQVVNELGITLALDDYGTGYSSLAYLKRFPLQRLKIDRCFMEGVPTDSDNMAIVRTTIELAHELRLKVVAEGIETAEQHRFLQACGCDEVQGYLIGRPIPLDEVAKHCAQAKLK